HCFNWQAIDAAHEKKELTIEEIEKITEHFPNILRLSLSGGEPFVRPDMPEICRLFYKNCKVKHITIPTNASMPQRTYEMTEQILKNCPKAYINVSLSLDELGEKRDEFVGCKGSFEKLQETHAKLKELKKRYDNFGLSVITTQTKDNQQELKKIYDYAKNVLEVDNFAFNVARGSPKYPVQTDVDMDVYREMAKTVRRDVKKRKSGFNFPFVKMFIAKKFLLYRYVLKTHREKRYQIPCYAGRLRCVIGETGELYPCEMLMFEKKGFSFGNFRDYDYDFRKIWKDDKAKRIRKWIKDTKCFCIHDCDLTINILFNIRLLTTLYREWKRMNR
ncbi:radical SAM protein, partial [Candidatus Woesearchaeota archaeon]|nr:radical SAM protein [Candidatus Woesearchaeota archaeon]